MFWYLIHLLPILSRILIEGEEVNAMIEIADVQQYIISSNSLAGDSKYEIRISYLGSLGSTFKLNWGCVSDPSRRLLDTEKLVFSTDFKGNILGGCNIVSVQAFRNSRAINNEARDRSIWYSIKLERYNHFLQVPTSVIPAIGGIIIALAFSIIFYKIIIYNQSKDRVKDS